MLVAQAVQQHKLQMTWTGPHEVLRAVNPFVYSVRPCVRDQGNWRPMTVHVVRMRRFANAPLGTPADAEAIERAARQDYPDNIPKRIVAHRAQRRGLELKVRWLGFDATHDTWEPVANMAADVPDMVEAYLYSKQGDAVVRRALNRYFPAGGN